MKRKSFSLAAFFGIGLATILNLHAWACGLFQEPLGVLAQQAVSENSAVSSAATARLRAKGPEGLDALLKAHAATIQKHEKQAWSAQEQGHDSEWTQLKAALDAVGGQCDCYASGLYWYNDFEKAKAAARASGKPILSLRLLGRLDEEYSCANSRFFRTTLYANADVSTYLRQHFILHWQSVRPVPKITIDFGDGRKIERTLTGNSVHYVLDSQGEPVDALPGLYGPQAFLNHLAQAERAGLACAGWARDRKREYLRQYHRQCRAAIDKRWNEDLAQTGAEPQPFPGLAAINARGAVPTAQMAGQLAISKRAIESPILKSTQPKDERPATPGRAEVQDKTWVKIAALHADDAQLDGATRRLILSKRPTAFEASQLATSKKLVEDPFLRTLRNLQRSIAEDTVRNEFVLHARIHDWFVQNVAPEDLSSLNAKVYAELFLMPESDPWLGLAPTDTFTGLENNGLIEAPLRKSFSESAAPPGSKTN